MNLQVARPRWKTGCNFCHRARCYDCVEVDGADSGLIARIRICRECYAELLVLAPLAFAQEAPHG